MSRYTMECGAIVDTKSSLKKFEENTRWNGQNHISLATGDQWVHETLYQSSNGRWYVVRTSQWKGSSPFAEFVTAAEATHWLIRNEYLENEIPEELQENISEICE